MRRSELFQKQAVQAVQKKCRKIEPTTAKVLEIVEWSFLDRHIKEVVGKNIVYKSAIWEEVYPNEELFLSRYIRAMAEKNKKKNNEVSAREEVVNKLIETSYAFVRIHGEYSFFNSLAESIQFFSKYLKGEPRYLAKLIKKSLIEGKVYRKYIWDSARKDIMLKDIEKFLI